MLFLESKWYDKDLNLAQESHLPALSLHKIPLGYRPNKGESAFL